ncbi:hypothetical protein [Massilia rubra]|uniref:Recombination-associated protein RdgC n=1 Tax=Massilia rubra TaxID=2607910 RepID=A0ABX0LTY6_9BURK|nr:hypothetical protein [Massilia rubra]NHZ35347.1 hypothetical protein [Massilia rubra]
METKKTNKQLFYKQAQFAKPSSVPLQHLLHRAIKKLSVLQRKEHIFEATLTDGGMPEASMRLINSARADAGFQLGTLIQFSPGANHLVMSQAVNEAADELDVSKLPAPEGKHFIDSPLYFAVRDNHVVFIQSRSLRSEAFESHLNWLLKQSGAMAKDQRVVLTDVIPQDIRKKLQDKPIKRVLLRAPFFETQGNAEEIVGSRATRAAKAGVGLGLKIVKALMSPEKFQALKVDQMTELNNVQLNLEVKVAGKHKAKSAVNENDMMRTLLQALGQVENIDFVQVEIEGAGTKKGNQLRVREHVSIESVDGILTTAGAYHALVGWLESLIDKGHISAQD